MTASVLTLVYGDVRLVTIPFYDEASSSIEKLASSFRMDGYQSMKIYPPTTSAEGFSRSHVWILTPGPGPFVDPGRIKGGKGDYRSTVV
jgi:hypothetical protein